MAGINGDAKVNNSKMKGNYENYNNFDLNEIRPLKTAQAKDSVDADSLQQVHVNLPQITGTDDPDTFVPKTKGPNKLKGTYEAVMAHLSLSQTKEKDKNFDRNEIRPHRTEQAKESVDSDSSQLVHVNMPQITGTDDPDTFVPKTKELNKLKGTYEGVMTHLDLSQKARIPFLISIALCAVPLIVLIAIIASWPHRIPLYMKLDVCVDKECMDVSSQILLWANTSVKSQDICNDPYEWACGKFEHEYLEQLELDTFGIKGGEWNLKARADDEEISEIYSFITKMPSTRSPTLAQSILKDLYTQCMTSQKINKQGSNDDTELNKIISSIKMKSSDVP